MTIEDIPLIPPPVGFSFNDGGNALRDVTDDWDQFEDTDDGGIHLHEAQDNSYEPGQSSTIEAEMTRAAVITPASPGLSEHALTTSSSSTTTTRQSTPNIVDFSQLPPQLHPAISIGVQRVSSCYFSLGSSEHENTSIAELLSQWGEESRTSGKTSSYSHGVFKDPSHGSTGNGGATASAANIRMATKKDKDIQYRNDQDFNIENTNASAANSDAIDVVGYHDVLMQVFNFLDAPSLAAFSETARRPNFEVFYFLQLQLQKALISKSTVALTASDHQSSLTAIAGSSCLSRLASLDKQKAEDIVQGYLQSNSTLKTMPLSHSLAYLKHALLQRTLHLSSGDDSSGNMDSTKRGQALASAALLVTVIGAAVMSGSAPDTVALSESFGSEFPNMIFGMGFMGSALMATRRHQTNVSNQADDEGSRHDENVTVANDDEASAVYVGENQYPPQHHTMRERAEQMARTIQDLPSSLIELRNNLNATLSNAAQQQYYDVQHQLSERPSQVMLATPYDHIPDMEKKKEECKMSQNPNGEGGSSEISSQKISRKLPSGAVGAYSNAIKLATSAVSKHIKAERKAKFEALSLDEQRHVSMTFLDACTSDDGLSTVKEMIHHMDVDGFFTGADGSETCALHNASFNGAAKVIEFLCGGVDFCDSQMELPEDGGLCDVNLVDTNGWTALHFAAGANSVAATKALVANGADITVEANNGYTPLLWAQRMSNEDVVSALKQATLEKGVSQGASWMMSRQPLSDIASRFFSLIPSQAS